MDTNKHRESHKSTIKQLNILVPKRTYRHLVQISVREGLSLSKIVTTLIESAYQSRENKD